MTAPDLPPLPESVYKMLVGAYAAHSVGLNMERMRLNVDTAIRAALAAERAAAVQEERARCVSIAKDELQWHHECARNCAGDEDAEMHSFGESTAFRIVQNITTPEIPNA